MKPRSVSVFSTNSFGLAAMLAVALWGLTSKVDAAVLTPIMMAAAAVPVLIMDVFVHRVHLRPSTGLDWRSTRERDWGRIGTKWLGAAGVLAGCALAFFVFPEYQSKFYTRFYTFMTWFLPFVLVFGAAYFAFLDRFLVEAKDAYWHMGALILGRTREVDWWKVQDLARTWVVKGFFVPLMYVYATSNYDGFRHAFRAEQPDTFVYWFEVLYQLAFVVDVVFTTMGYLVTMRIFDTQVRSAEPTLTGWVAAILCYMPFFRLIGSQYIVYEGGYQWGEWLAAYPVAKAAWGVGILAWVWIFGLTTVHFGCRFSNLTNRGVLTNGFYALTKHPAYVSKIASYAMVSIPFVYNGSALDVIHDCSVLLLLAGVYWLRAKTEENHLSLMDPDYVRYGLYMNERSVFAFVGRIFPFLRYRPPKGWYGDPAAPPSTFVRYDPETGTLGVAAREG